MRRRVLAAAAILATLAATACSSSSKSSSSSSSAASASSSASSSGGSSGGSSSGGSVTLHLGFFPNLTHASALVGVKEGIFAKDLGSGVNLQTSTFNAGPAEVQALFSGA